MAGDLTCGEGERGREGGREVGREGGREGGMEGREREICKYKSAFLCRYSMSQKVDRSKKFGVSLLHRCISYFYSSINLNTNSEL